MARAGQEGHAKNPGNIKRPQIPSMAAPMSSPILDLALVLLLLACKGVNGQCYLMDADSDCTHSYKRGADCEAVLHYKPISTVRACTWCPPTSPPN